MHITSISLVIRQGSSLPKQSQRSKSVLSDRSRSLGLFQKRRIQLIAKLQKTVFTYSRLSLSRNRRDPQKQFEISVLRHIRFVVLRKKQFEQPIFTNDYVI